MMAWLRQQWALFVDSYVVEEAMLKTSPRSLLGILSVAVLFTLLPAYIEPIASYVRFRAAWLPATMAVLAVFLSYGFHAVKGRPPWAPVFVLLDTAFYAASIALAASLTAPPASHAYAVILGIMLASGQARDYALTLPFALSVCLPSIGIVILFDRGLTDFLIISFSCALTLWLSYQTGLQRALRRQNEGLRVALVASDKVTNESMEIALSSTLVGVGQFLHELRNLLSATSNNLQYLSEQDASASERREAINDLLKTQARTKDLVDRTIDDLRRKAKGRSEAFDVGEALRGSFERCAGSARCDVTIPSDPFSVMADPEALRGVIEVLVANAAQAGAANVWLRSSIDASYRSVTLEVADDGPGLSPEAMEKLFQPFGTHGKKHGTGLGLYLSKRRVELMGGRMSARNDPKGGAVFTVVLPGSRPPPRPADLDQATPC